MRTISHDKINDEIITSIPRKFRQDKFTTSSDFTETKQQLTTSDPRVLIKRRTCIFIECIVDLQKNIF